MISAMPSGVELTIQLSAPTLGDVDGSDIAVRIMAGPAGSASAPVARAMHADLADESDEWRLVMHEFLARVAAMLESPAASHGGLASRNGVSRPALVRGTSPLSWTRELHQPPRDTLTRVAVGDLEIDIPAHRVWQQGKPVTLTRQEFALLLVLLNRAGEVVLRHELQRELWDHEFPAGSRALDQCIFKLRRKLERDPRAPRYLHCIRGVGYRFDIVPADGN